MPRYAFNGTWNSEKTEDLQTSVRHSDANTGNLGLNGAAGDLPARGCGGRGRRGALRVVQGVSDGR